MEALSKQQQRLINKAKVQQQELQNQFPDFVIKFEIRPGLAARGYEYALYFQPITPKGELLAKLVGWFPTRPEWRPFDCLSLDGEKTEMEYFWHLYSSQEELERNCCFLIENTRELQRRCRRKLVRLELCSLLLPVVFLLAAWCGWALTWEPQNQSQPNPAAAQTRPKPGRN